MKTWLRILFIVLSIGGGFTGVVLSITPLFTSAGLPIASAVLYLIFIGLYSYGVFAGVRLVERGDTKHLLRFYWLQVPWVSSPFIAYRFAAGFHASALIYWFGFNAQFRLGSDWQVSLFQDKPFAVGVNIFAIAAIAMIKRSEKKAAQPGATDNPDDAQRLREDH